MGADSLYGITPDKIREIQFMKGAPFTTKFIKKFDKDWAGVVLAAQTLKGRRKDQHK